MPDRSASRVADADEVLAELLTTRIITAAKALAAERDDLEAKVLELRRTPFTLRAMEDRAKKAEAERDAETRRADQLAVLLAKTLRYMDHHDGCGMGMMVCDCGRDALIADFEQIVADRLTGEDKT